MKKIQYFCDLCMLETKWNESITAGYLGMFFQYKHVCKTCMQSVVKHMKGLKKDAK